MNTKTKQDKFATYRNRKRDNGMVLLRCWVPEHVATRLDRIGPTRAFAIEKITTEYGGTA